MTQIVRKPQLVRAVEERTTGENTPFNLWWLKLLEAAEAEHFPINADDPESYFEYYDDGDTPEEALAEEMSYCDDFVGKGSIN